MVVSFNYNLTENMDGNNKKCKIQLKKALFSVSVIIIYILNKYITKNQDRMICICLH